MSEAATAGPALFRVGDGKLWKMDVATGGDVWTSPVGFRSRVHDIGDGRLLVSEFASSGGYQILNAANGRQLAEVSRTMINVTQGLVLAQSDAEDLQGLDPATGNVRWTVPRAASALGFYASDDVLCFTVNESGTTQPVLRGVDRQTGALRWSYRQPKNSRLLIPLQSSDLVSTRVVWGYENLAHLAVIEKRRLTLHCADITAGKRLWATPLLEVATEEAEAAIEVLRVDTVSTLSVATIRDRRINPDNSGLIAVAQGSVRWRRPLLNPSVAVTPDGRLFAATYDSVLHELDPATGVTLWSTPTPGAADLFTAANTIVAKIEWSLTGYRLTTK
ncbi:PQQ-binding-like beta-propeller repeat protein [Actinoplanes sp. NPDC051859]|uniref:outer membrane protein assembly factor BamB family protein n=1 Tax=Actinoplanes sp. NPDC051859 TaxID=3363909 RepID=UPI0037B40099